MKRVILILIGVCLVLPFYETQKVKQEFLRCPYYVESNLEKYIRYFKKNRFLSLEDIVLRVNVGLDTFHPEEKEANLQDGKLILVNKFHYLKPDYVPDLVLMDVRYSYEQKYADAEAYEHFISMAEAARLDGILLYNVSSYRSYSLQDKLYQDYFKKDPSVDTYSAKPGYSEHQTGLAFDLNSIRDSFSDTKEGIWLANNAHIYGFILRYPKGKEFITGYKYEPWHYRYVGVEVAQYIFEHQITFEEYYVKFVQ